MIFCVEDDNSIRELIVYTLNASGFKAKGFSGAESFFDAIKTEVPRLIMLDIMLPGTDGMEILHMLKENSRTKAIPVIMATAKGSEYDKVTGLDSGADDYLVKPFGMMEMVAHVKAVLRRTDNTQKQSVNMCGIVIDSEKHIALCGDKKLNLTLKEFEMLKLFMENPGKVFTREQLLEIIWGTSFMGESRTVDVHIGTLRTKLGDCGYLIETVRGLGYRSQSI